MKIDPKSARDIFERAKSIQRMILDAQEDLKQLRADEIEAMIGEYTDKATAKAIRADLSEIIALAKVEAKGDIEREKVAAKMAHRREVADVLGVQLDLPANAVDPYERSDAADFKRRLVERHNEGAALKHKQQQAEDAA